MKKEIYYYIDIQYSCHSRYEREFEFADFNTADRVYDLLLTSETYKSAYSMRLLETVITDTTVKFNTLKEKINESYFAD